MFPCGRLTRGGASCRSYWLAKSSDDTKNYQSIPILNTFGSGINVILSKDSELSEVSELQSTDTEEVVK